MDRRNLSIKHRTLLFLSVTLASFLVAALVFTNMFIDRFTQDISARNLDLAFHVAGSVRIFLEHHLAELKELRLAIGEHGLEELEAIGEELDRIYAFHPLLELVQVVDRSGRVIRVSPENPGFQGMDLSGQSSFLNALSLPRDCIYWSEAFISPQSLNPVVNITLPLEGGMLMANLNLNRLSEIANIGNSFKGEIVMITDRNGVVIGHPAYEMVSISDNLADHQSIRDALSGKTGTYREVIDGTSGLVSVVPIERSGWVVAVYQPLEAALGIVLKVRSATIFGTLLSTLVFLVALVAFLRMVIRPVKTMERQMNLIAAGDYNSTLEMPFLEFEGIVKAFNGMVDAIQQREDTIKTSEERFRVLFDEAAEPIYLMDGLGRLLAANKRASLDMGYTAKEFSRMNVSDFIVGQDRSAIEDSLSAIRKNEAATDEGQHRRKDGTVFPVEVRIAMMETEEDNRFIAHVRDITKRKKFEEALKASEERFRKAFMIFPDAMTISTFEEGIYEDVNDGFTSVTGWEKCEVIGKTVQEVGLWEAPFDRQEFLGQLLFEGGYETQEIRFYKKDGTLRLGLVSAAPFAIDGISYILSITRDITELKKAQSSLRETNDLLSAIVDSSPLGIVQTDTEGTVHLWNPAAEKIFGWKPEEVLNRPAPTIPEDRRDEFRRLYQKVLDGENLFGFETQRKRKDGTLVDVSISLARLSMMPGKDEIMGIVEDITEKKAAEDALRDSEERFRGISEGIFDGIGISSHGILLETNSQFATMFGYAMEDLKGKKILDLISPKWQDLVLEKLETDCLEMYECEVLHKSGTPFWVEVRGIRTTYQGRAVRVAALRDVTDQRRAENVLKEREKRFRLLYENNPLAYQSLDNDGNYIEVNTAWENLMGYNREVVVGRKNLRDFIDPDYREVLDDYIIRLRKTGEEKVTDIRFLTKNGNGVHVALSGKASVDEDTGLWRTHCLLTDITDRIRMEAALKKNAQLAAVGQVASGIAHEINNPLATISASTEALLARIPSLRKGIRKNHGASEQIDLFADYLSMIKEEVDRSGKIMRDLQDFSRVKEYIMKPVDMAELVESTVRLLNLQSHLVRYHIQLEMEPEPIEVPGDRDRLRQVLIILFTNALEAMPEGGKIEVVLSVDRENKTCTLSVADEGSGVREEELDQIFQPFYTTKSSGGGTGLGLSIADTIIVKHNGRIVPLINTHGGMTFTVCLPSGIAIDSSGKS